MYVCVPRVALSGFAAHNATLTRSIIKITMLSDHDGVLRCRRKLTIRVTRSGIASEVCMYIYTNRRVFLHKQWLLHFVRRLLLGDRFRDYRHFRSFSHTADADERMRCELMFRLASTVITVYRLVIEFLEMARVGNPTERTYTTLQLTRSSRSLE